jgi:hypothetical protein
MGIGADWPYRSDLGFRVFEKDGMMENHVETLSAVELDAVLERSSAKEAAIFSATEAVITAIGEPDGTLTVAALVELSKAAGRILAALAANDMPEESFSNMRSEFDGPMGEDELTGAVVGHFVLQNLGDDVPMNLDGKKYLMEIGSILGSDHLEGLRRNVAFMIKVEGFN